MSDSHYPDRDTNDASSAFEERLRGVPRRSLPSEWRKRILDCACADDDGKVNWWQRLPKPLVWPVAACWIASLGLHLTTPEHASYRDFSVAGAVADDTEKSAIQEPLKEQAKENAAREETALMFAEWIERNRSFGVDVGVGLATGGFEIY